jgi:hypothetical protein
MKPAVLMVYQKAVRKAAMKDASTAVVLVVQLAVRRAIVKAESKAD